MVKSLIDSAKIQIAGMVKGMVFPFRFPFRNGIGIHSEHYLPEWEWDSFRKLYAGMGMGVHSDKTRNGPMSAIVK